MKALDLQTKTYHKVVSLNYDTNTVVLESPEYGRTSNTLDNVRLIPDTKEDLYSTFQYMLNSIVFYEIFKR